MKKYKGLERIVFDDMKDTNIHHFAMNLHLEAYTFAHKFLYNKSIIDAACGTCFGSMIYSTACKKLYGVDKSKKAIKYGEKLPMFCPSKFEVKNLETDELRSADVCVSVETIEHLTPEAIFLPKLKTKELIFTVPLGKTSDGSYHLVDFLTVQDFEDYLKVRGWEVKENYIGENAMYLGRAIR